MLKIEAIENKWYNRFFPPPYPQFTFEELAAAEPELLRLLERAREGRATCNAPCYCRRGESPLLHAAAVRLAGPENGKGPLASEGALELVSRTLCDALPACPPGCPGCRDQEALDRERLEGYAKKRAWWNRSFKESLGL